VRAVAVGRADADVWTEIAWLAVAAAADEPVLRQLIAEVRLMDAPPPWVVSALLARRLSGGEPAAAAALQALFLEILEDATGPMRLIEDDLLTVVRRDPACRSPLHALLDLKGLHALQSHRIAHRLWQRGRFDVAHRLASLASATLGVDIHPAVPIGRGVLLDHATGIVIGETAVVEDGVTILQGVTLGATGKVRGDRHPKVRSGVLLGAGALVLGNIEIGAMSKVGAGSVVLRAVPPHCTVAGIPARVVRSWRDRPVGLAAARRSAA
jgi:serine O-acetyltransferase